MRAVWKGKRSESTIHRLSLSSVTDDDRTRTPVNKQYSQCCVSHHCSSCARLSYRRLDVRLVRGVGWRRENSQGADERVPEPGEMDGQQYHQES